MKDNGLIAFPHRAGRALLAATMLSGVALTFAVPTAAQAQAQAAHDFSIPAGPLATVLNRFADQSGTEIIYEGSLTQGATSPGLSGRFGVVEALSRILAGSGLTYRQTGPRSFTLEPAPTTSSGAVQLGPVRVGADARNAAGNSREASATSPMRGYVARLSTTATKTETPVAEVPQSISVVTRDDLADRAVTDLSQALAYLPGVTPSPFGDDNRYDQSTTRGFRRDAGDFRDGLRFPTWNFSEPRSEIYGIERVEFLRGPASVLYGTTSPGGILNLISKRPTPENRGEVRLRAGSRDLYGIAGDISGPVNAGQAVRYRLVGLWERADNEISDTNRNRLFIAPSIEFRIADRTKLTLLTEYQRDRNKGWQYSPITGGYYSLYDTIPIAQPGFDRFYRDQYLATYLLDHELSDKVSFHSRGRYSRVNVDFRLTNDQGLNGTELSLSSDRHHDRNRSWLADNYAQIDWGNASLSNTTIVGTDFRHTRGNDRFGSAAAPSLDLLTKERAGQFVEPVLAPYYDGYLRQASIYAQNQSKIADQFVLLLGGRQDWYRQRTNLTALTKHSVFTWRAGAVWLAPYGLSPYFSYSESFRPQPGVSFSGDTFEPTSGRQFEGGLRYEPMSGVRLTLALYDLKQRNALVADLAHPGSSIQQGEITSRGLELEATASLIDGLNIVASYTLNDAKTTKDTDPALIGLRVSNEPKHRANAWVNYRAAHGRLSGLGLGAGIRYSSKTWDYYNVFATPGVTLVDAMVSYDFDNLSLALNARNLFNKKFVSSCYYVAFCHRGDRRSIMATLTWRYGSH